MKKLALTDISFQFEEKEVLVCVRAKAPIPSMNQQSAQPLGLSSGQSRWPQWASQLLEELIRTLLEDSQPVP